VQATLRFASLGASLHHSPFGGRGELASMHGKRLQARALLACPLPYEVRSGGAPPPPPPRGSPSFGESPPPGRPRLPLLCSARPVRPSCWGPQPGDEHQGVHRKTCSARAEEPLQRGGPKDEASVVRRTCSALGFFYNLKAQASSKRRAVQFPVPVQYRAEWPVQCPITFGEG
jgi:hypothetical protein